jgi:diguanylate cyclase (GGDEF)-like protein
VDGKLPAAGSDLGASSEELAKAWLVAIIERTPMDRLADGDHVAGAARRLAEIFGSLQAQATEEPPGVPSQGLPGQPDRPQDLRADDLDGSLDALVAEYQRYGHPFALALIELDGLREIYEAHGRESGDWMSTAATTMIRSQIRIVDRAFRVEDDAFCVLAPNVDADRLRRLGDRLARVVDGSQESEGPRISISAGVAACPEHGQDRGRLLEVARDALEAARAAEQPVAVAGRNGFHAARGS